MYDADNHLYETADAFTRYLPDDRRRDFFWTTDDAGHRHLVVGGRLWDYLPNPTFDPIGVAGCLTDVFARGASMLEARNAGYTFEPLAGRPEYQHPGPRLARMDDQGVDATLLFPTLVSGLEEATADDPGLTADLVRSFDRWLDDHWGFARDGRLFAVPVLSLADPDEAVRLLDWLLDRGARAVMVRPAPVPTAQGMRSPGDPMFDPVWGRCQEAGTLVCGHLSASGYHRYTGDWTGVYQMRPHLPQGPFAAIATHARAIMDFVTAMVVHGAVARHPRLRLVSVENGADWVPWLLSRFAVEHSRYPGSFPEDPVDAFERCVWVVPHWEEPVADLATHIPVERILAGSDFPHTDGLADPTDFAKSLDGVGSDDARRILRDNLRQLLAAA